MPRFSTVITGCGLRVELTRRVAELVRQLGPAQLEELATVITRLETSLKEAQWRN